MRLFLLATLMAMQIPAIAAADGIAIAFLPSRLPSKQCVPSGDVLLFAAAGRCGDAISCLLRFRSRSRSNFFRFCFCRLPPSKQLGACVPPFEKSELPVASNCAFFAPIVYFPVFCFPVLLNFQKSYNII